MHIDQWHDWLRLAILLVAAACLLILGYRWLKCRSVWDEEARDDWFMKVMWSLAAFEMQVEGLLRDTELRYRLAFVAAAAIVTLKTITKNYKRDRA